MTFNAGVPFLKLASVLFVVSLLAGCGGSPPPAIGKLENKADPALGQQPFGPMSQENYVLRAGDHVSVAVLNESDLSKEDLVIDANGAISIPVVGRVVAAGNTPGQLSAIVRKQLSGAYLVNPQVAVNVVSYASHQVTVDGSVVSPGVYQFQPGTRLSGAIALAGGPGRVAKLEQVVIFRADGDGLLAARFDYQAIRQGTSIDPVLQPRDRIVVGISSRSQFWQDFLSTVPLLAVFVRIL